MFNLPLKHHNYLSRIAMLVAVASFLCSAPTFAADKDFDAFWLKFKQALVKNDKDAVVSMTRCPFLFHSKQLTKQQLAQQIDSVLPAKTRLCLSKGQPKFQNNSHFAFCGDFVFTFSKVNGRYMLTDMDAND